ncbi:MAG: HemK2/MTQ2 family protein methyltransferase [Nitrososphaerales archaeon]
MVYKPMMSQKEIGLRKKWHDAGYVPMADRQDITVTCLGRKFVVPKEVHPPAPMTLLQKSVLKEVKETDRVLDMGTGSGVNAILAASKASSVIAVDINPYAVKCARNNAKLNGVSSRIKVFESDLFRNVKGRFDLIIFDPPFRWFKPRDIRERATADENFRTMRAFFKNVKKYLNTDGRVLTCYGTNGDMGHFQYLLDKNDFKVKTLNEKSLIRYGRKWMYYSYQLTA